MVNDNVGTAKRSMDVDDDGGNGSGLPLTASPFPLPPFRRNEPVGRPAVMLAFAAVTCMLVVVATALFGPRWWE